MISNMEQNPSHAIIPLVQELPPELVSLIVKSVADGVSAAIQKFVLVNNVKWSPGSKSANPLEIFAMKLTAEFGKDSTSEDERKAAKLHPFPFKKSLKAPIMASVEESKPVFLKLWEAGEKDNIAALCRIIGCGETLKFLQEKRIMAIKMIAKIRGDELVKLDPNSKIQ